MERDDKSFASLQDGKPIGEMHDDAIMENELLGIKLKHMLALGGLVLAFFVILITLWNCCAKSKDDSVEYTKPKDVRTVVAREIRPGLIMVQGYPTQDETLRIIEEYDAMQSGPHKVTNYGSSADCSNQTSLTSYFYQQPRESVTYPVAPSAPSGSHDRLIEAGYHGRPPPYGIDQQTHWR